MQDLEGLSSGRTSGFLPYLRAKFFPKVVKFFNRPPPQNYKIAFELIETLFLEVPESRFLPITKIFPFELFEETLKSTQNEKLQIATLNSIVRPKVNAPKLQRCTLGI